MDIAYPFRRNVGEPKDSFLARCGNYADTKYNPAGCHLAWDGPAPRGEPVIAPVSGKIVKVSYDKYLGYYDVIRNRYGDFYVCHFANKPNLSVGQSVTRAKTRVGTCGSSGNATGPHVHIVWYLAKHVGKAWGSVPFGNPFPMIHDDWERRYG